MWKYDSGRTGASPDALPGELHLQWVRDTVDTGFLPEADLRRRAAGSSEYEYARSGGRLDTDRQAIAGKICCLVLKHFPFVVMATIGKSVRWNATTHVRDAFRFAGILSLFGVSQRSLFNNRRCRLRSAKRCRCDRNATDDHRNQHARGKADIHRAFPFSGAPVRFAHCNHSASI